jgi:hypothetical protein
VEADSSSSVYKTGVYTLSGLRQDISWISFVLMRRTDQTSVVSPEGHILLQGKKDNESDGVQCFFAPSFFHRVSGSY